MTSIVLALVRFSVSLDLRRAISCLEEPGRGSLDYGEERHKEEIADTCYQRQKPTVRLICASPAPQRQQRQARRQSYDEGRLSAAEASTHRCLHRGYR